MPLSVFAYAARQHEKRMPTGWQMCAFDRPSVAMSSALFK